MWTDNFTKRTEREATKEQHDSTVAKSYINHIFCRFYAHKALISDRTYYFLSDIVAEINKLMGAYHRKTTPYHPQVNGACGIRNKSIGTMLSRIVKEQHDDWDDLRFVQLAHIRWSMLYHTRCQLVVKQSSCPSSFSNQQSSPYRFFSSSA